MHRHPRLPVLLAIVSALFLRALIPAGWMPAPGEGAFAIEPCPAAEPGPSIQMAGHHGAAGKHDHSHKMDHGDCAFSPLQIGFTSADLPPLARATAVESELPISSPAGPTFKTGPPALTPPATGPPAIA